MNYRDRISIEPGKRFGRPVIRGMRITVDDVLSWLASGMSQAEILQAYPELEAGDVQACLAYAADKTRRVTVVAA
ncbi:MAG TPA: DUF433 domain-containing protein [Kiloniellales bacterium]|nr:DUF433 domain-containing protein [Kiloniellales bacterium]